MTYRINSPGVATSVGLTTVSNTPQFPLGTLVEGVDDANNVAGTFIYMEGVEGTQFGSWVTYSYDNDDTTLLTGSSVGPVAVAVAAIGADHYGFYQIRGKAFAKADAGVVGGSYVYASSTPGSVGSISSNPPVAHARSSSDEVGGTAEYELYSPVIGSA